MQIYVSINSQILDMENINTFIEIMNMFHLKAFSVSHSRYENVEQASSTFFNTPILVTVKILQEIVFICLFLNDV